MANDVVMLARTAGLNWIWCHIDDIAPPVAEYLEEREFVLVGESGEHRAFSKKGASRTVLYQILCNANKKGETAFTLESSFDVCQIESICNFFAASGWEHEMEWNLRIHRGEGTEIATHMPTDYAPGKDAR